MTPPQTLAEWQAQRAQVRATAWKLLGDLPPLVTPQARTLWQIPREHYTIEKFAFDNGYNSTIYGYVLIPHGLTAPAPAVLFNHWHAGQYEVGKDEMFKDRVKVPAIGPALAEAGYVVMGIDAYGFGERQGFGPGSERNLNMMIELALAKRFLWEGRTYWGMIVRDDLMALDYLCTRPEIDPNRIAATGMSLGASRTTWVSAMDERIKVTIPVAQMTRYQDFAARGEFNHHGIYYYLPGALVSGIDMEHIASLTAPRAQLVLVGDQDALAPIEGVRTINTFASKVYDLYGVADHFKTVIDPGIAHDYTPTMFTAMMDWLKRYL
ncbi:MAG: prolyl oligopeptidase family serine peptidase [Chloroflexi bacterium]|nr:prolyl oligopeptidase family serine peptidase [Chloroflexota bacterium]